MKRLGLVLMGVALVLGLAQCKKNVEPLASGVVPGVGDGEIVLRLVGESSKLAVFPATGAVYYTAGDVIHVASGGTYRGTLTYHSDDDGGYFSGNLTSAPSSGAKMYFYFMGNKDLNEDSPTSSISVNISDQTENYPVIACGESVEGYGETTEYHATMKNKCALVKFDVESSASPTMPTLIGGMNNVITFTFSDSGVGTVNTSNAGGIKLRGGSGERWAVVLKQDEVESLTKKYVANSEIVTSAHGNIPSINDNDYLSTGIGVTVTSRELPEGAIPGLFTINDNGDQVLFSKGNLQYQASTNTWRFAENQYDYVGDATNGNVYENEVKCNNSLISDSYTGWIDLFGWGTSGYNNKYPYMTSTTSTDYGPTGANSLTGTYANYNWGVYIGSTITNGGGSSSWRTLQYDDIRYMSLHSTAGFATVAGTTGIIFLPDTFTDPKTNNGSGAFVGGVNAYTANVYESGEEWEAMEAEGAVFMPAAGYRIGTEPAGIQQWGYYWLEEVYDADNALCTSFQSNYFSAAGALPRFGGTSVRLYMSCE